MGVGVTHVQRLSGHIPRHNPLNLEAKYSRSYIETITFPRHAGQGDARDEYLGSSNAKRGQRLL